MAKKQKFPHLVGSKWTAQQTTLGWRHFQVVNRKNQGKWVFAELVAACDPQVRFWLNASILKNRQLWQAGWQRLANLETSEVIPESCPNEVHRTNTPTLRSK
ncbi:TIGR02450 family Trp-rich protein [Romeria aff. gracilis LEGE 07310]|uniref:TIGR02450 family Trp-rich protein n=1 Tax=Vasconcelosia minhoensis LEGE 07310 TaxID=915328 RepID=A0A8J7A4V6_9CYAN|nr:TIGR02450 family Trp-rich protein [Romeria gracilis]MBE9075940.1 TIGR02450 family Trp-rich protein [Romeria aff. gracilis LEGE 07310]